jgi:enterochelin esterase-like enzyme
VAQRRQHVLGGRLVLRDRAGYDGVRAQQDRRERAERNRPPAYAHAADVREHEPGDRARRDERHSDEQQGLGRVTSELLEGERVGEGGALAQRSDVAQEVQPAEAAEHDQRREHPRRRLGVRAAIALICAMWLGVGVYGVVAYGHNYYRYRGFAPPVDPPGVPHGKLLERHFWSPALHQRRSYLIYLPPGYAAAVARGVRFPVLYLLHGSPGGGDLFVNAGGVGVALDGLVSRRDIQPFLIVMPSGGDGTFMSDTEWADTPHGRYESLVLDLVKTVDATWPTLPDRRHRALAGNSEGAYGAVNIALRHLAEFSLAESWSGYYVQHANGPFARSDAATVVANSPALYVASLEPRLRRLPFAAFMYTSWHDLPLAGRRFARGLRDAGARRVRFAVFSGGHTWQLWRRQAPEALLFAGRWFDSAR